MSKKLFKELIKRASQPVPKEAIWLAPLLYYDTSHAY